MPLRLILGVYRAVDVGAFGVVPRHQPFRGHDLHELEHGGVHPPPRPIATATSRTVLGPRAHNTRRMATSASVGFRDWVTGRSMYKDLRIRRYERLRRLITGPRERHARLPGSKRVDGAARNQEGRWSGGQPFRRELLQQRCRVLVHVDARRRRGCCRRPSPSPSRAASCPGCPWRWRSAPCATRKVHHDVPAPARGLVQRPSGPGCPCR